MKITKRDISELIEVIAAIIGGLIIFFSIVFFIAYFIERDTSAQYNECLSSNARKSKCKADYYQTNSLFYEK